MWLSASRNHNSYLSRRVEVGEHIRVPRCYRGKDIEWWMDVIGFQDERYDEVDDIARAAGAVVTTGRHT